VVHSYDYGPSDPYFKNCARATKKFKNITKTLAEEHQFLQAYYSYRSLYGEPVQVGNRMPFHCSLYSQRVLDALQPFSELRNSKTTLVAQSATDNNITYDSGIYVFIDHKAEQCMCGEIKLIPLNNIQTFLVLTMNDTKPLSDVGLLEINENSSEDEVWLCMPAAKMLDLYPLHHYVIGCGKFLVLHHAV
jgi:hypothetical protein